MRFICAPDSFKESLTATEAAAAMARGIRQVLPHAEVDCCPIADGGEGTVDALVHATGGRLIHTSIRGPLGDPVTATFGMLGDGKTAAIEMAAASGLALVPIDNRNPLKTHTLGTGQLVAAALDHGASAIILGIGGSATNDGGCATAQALGVRFFDPEGRHINEPISGAMLQRLGRIDANAIDPRLEVTPITVACDVTNPLTGPEGAAAIYGPQKGASSEQVAALDHGLAHLAHLLRRDLGRDVEHLPGSGAAGGLGGGLVAFLGAELKPGAALVLEALDFDRRAAGADVCLTGEGRLDGQSLSGKACLTAARAAARHGTPTYALVGSLGPDAHRTLDAGLAGFRLIGEGLPAGESIRRAAELLQQAAARLTEALSADKK